MRKIFSKSILFLFLFVAFFTVQVEAAPVVSNNPNDIANLTYVIGEHHIPSNTALTPRRVMLAATTIAGEPTLENMIIYFKNHRGEWVDAADGGKAITPPAQFNITAAYQVGVLHRFVTGVEIDQNNQMVYVDGTVDLTATVFPVNASNKNISWSSNNVDVATVNSSGLVTAISPGEATITVTTSSGSKTDTITITVEPIPTVNNIEFSSEPTDLTSVLNNETVVITLTTTTADANIYYTLDGSEPTTDSYLYDAGAKPEIETTNQFGETITFQARAFKDGKEPSDILEETIVFEAADEVTVTNATNLTLAIENNDVSIINIGANFSGDVDATRTGSNDFTIDFDEYTMTGNLMITADSVSEINLEGTADISLDGNLTISAAVGTVNNNINISGEIEIVAIGPDSWFQFGNALRMSIRAATGRIINAAATITEGISVNPELKSETGLTLGGNLSQPTIKLESPVIIEIDEDTDGDDPNLVVDSFYCEIENLSNKTAQIYANKNTVASGNYNQAGGDGEITERQVRPTFDPHSGAVANGTELIIESVDADVIYYTLDGTEPTTDSLEYDETDKPIIGPGMTVRAMAVRAGYEDSRISQANYTAPVMGGAIEIDGILKYGETLIVNLTDLEYFPALILNDDEPTYQWYRNGNVINDATSATYELGVNDIGAMLHVVITADGTHAIGSVTSASVGSVDKADGPTAPGAPTEQSVTDNAIILNEVSGAEYRIVGGSWQTSPVFTDLNYFTDYEFEMRYKETDTHFASDPGDSAVFKTAQKTVDISTIEGVTVPVKGESSVTEITESDQFTGIVTWMPSHEEFLPNTEYTAIIELTAKEGYTFVGVDADFFAVAGATATNDVDGHVVTAVFPATDKLEQTGSPSIDGLPATYDSELTANAGNLIVQTDLTYTWYRSSNDIYETGDVEVYEGTNYTPTVEDIGYYLVVVATTPDAHGYGFAATNIVVKGEGPETPAAPSAEVVTDTSIVLEEIAGAEYKMSEGAWQDSREFTGLEPNTEYQFYARIKETATHFASDSSEARDITTAKTTVSISVIEGITTPVKDGVPIDSITETDQFTGTVTWDPADDPFTTGTVYTATITLEAKEDYTFAGVVEDFFTVASATATNASDSGVITAVFPSTLPSQEGTPGISGLPATYDSDLTAHEGSLEVDTNLTYTWYRSSNETYEGNEYQLGTGTTYTPVAADIDQYLIVVVTTPDAYGEGYVVTDPVEKADQTEMATMPTVHPDIEPTKDTITLTGIPSHEYALASFNGEPEEPHNWQDSNIFAGLEAGFEYTFVSRIRETATHKPSDPVESGGIQTQPLSDESKILSYGIAGQIGDTIIDENELNLEMPSGTDVTNLVANFTTSDYIQSIRVGEVDQESGVTANNFTYYVSYMVIAENGSDTNWNVTVHVVEKEELETKITEANDAKLNIITTDDGEGVYVDEEWVTSAEMAELNAAIAAAQLIFDNPDASQAMVNQAETDLDNKINEFNNAKQFGLRKYDIMIDEAVSASVIEVGDALAESVLSGTFKDSEEVEVPGTLAWDDDTIIVNASETFNWTFTPDNADYYKIMSGIVNVIALDRSELLAAIDSANLNKDSVVISVDGSDVPTDEEWVTAADLSDYEAAIAIAQGVYDEQEVTQDAIDTAKDNLITATNDFNAAKQAGTLVVLRTATVELSSGSAVFHYRFFSDLEGQIEIDYGDVLDEPIFLNLETSMVSIQAKSGETVEHEGTASLDSLGIVDGQVVYDDIEELITAFDLDIQSWTQPPTHIELDLKGGIGENSWDLDPIVIELDAADLEIIDALFIGNIGAQVQDDVVAVGTLPHFILNVVIKDDSDVEVYNKPVEANEHGNVIVEEFIEPGYTIIVGHGTAQKEYVVENLVLTVLDRANNNVGGKADPEQEVTISLVGWSGPVRTVIDERNILAEGDGNWAFDYNTTDYNFADYEFSVFIEDENGNQTRIYRDHVLSIWVTPYNIHVPHHTGTDVVFNETFEIGIGEFFFLEGVNESDFELTGVLEELNVESVTFNPASPQVVEVLVTGVLNISSNDWDQHYDDTGMHIMLGDIIVKASGHTGSNDLEHYVIVHKEPIESELVVTIDEGGRLHGHHWAAHSEVEIHVERGGINIMTYQIETNYGGHFMVRDWMFAEHEVALQVDDVITVHEIDDPSVTHSVTVELIDIVIDVENNKITGTTTPNRWVEVFVKTNGEWHHEWPYGEAQADSEGNFVIDLIEFDDEEYQLQPGDYGSVYTKMVDNASTYTNWSIEPEAYQEASLWSDSEYYYLNNPENVNVAIELNDASLTRINDGTNDLVNLTDYEIAFIENPYGGNDNLILKTVYLNSALSNVLDEVTLTLYFDEGTDTAHTRQLVITALNPVDIYVDETGDDVNGDGTEEDPYATIGKALEIAVMGDTIHLADGIYEEDVMIPVHLGKITLQGSGENTEIIGYLNHEFISEDEETPAQFPSDVTFDNFKVVGDVFLAPGSTTNNLLIEGDVDAQGGTSITNTYIDGNFEIIGIETSLKNVHITGNAYFGGPSVGLENVTVDGIIYGKILYDFEIKANETTNLYKDQDELQDAYISFKVPQSIAGFEAEMGDNRKITIDLNGVQLDPNANWSLGDLDDVLDLNVMEWSIELEVKVGQTLAAGTTVIITANQGVVHTTDDDYIYANLVRDHEAPWWDELWYNTSYPLDEFIPDMWADPDRLYVEQFNGEDDEIINEEFRLNLMIGEFNETLVNTDFRLEGILEGLNIDSVERDNEKPNEAIIAISGPLNISSEEWETRHNQGFGHMDGYIVAIGEAAYSGSEDVSAYISVETPTHEISIHPHHFEIETYDGDINVNFEREFEISLGFEQFGSELDESDFELGGAFVGQNVTEADLAITDIRVHDEYEHHLFVTISGYLNITDENWSDNDNHDIEGTIKVKASAHTGTEDYIAAVWLAKFGDDDHHQPHIQIVDHGYNSYVEVFNFPENASILLIVDRGGTIITTITDQNTNEWGYGSIDLTALVELEAGDIVTVKTNDEETIVSRVFEVITYVINQGENKITGTSPSNANLRIVVDYTNVEVFAEANADGNWEVLFGADHTLDYGDQGRIYIYDQHGSAVVRMWDIPA